MRGRGGGRGVGTPSGWRHSCIRGIGSSRLRLLCWGLPIAAEPWGGSQHPPHSGASWAALLTTAGCHRRKLLTSHNSLRFVFPSNSRWPIWGLLRPLGAGRCSFLMSCAHMDTRTSGAAMCCLEQASPGEPIQGPGVPGGSRAQPVSSDKLFMNELFVVQGVHQLL